LSKKLAPVIGQANFYYYFLHLWGLSDKIFLIVFVPQMLSVALKSLICI
jgi:hypothetical protein